MFKYDKLSPRLAVLIKLSGGFVPRQPCSQGLTAEIHPKTPCQDNEIWSMLIADFNGQAVYAPLW